MAVITRPNSPYYWINYKPPGAKQIRISTRILVKASSPEQSKENRRLAEAVFDTLLGDLARRRFKLPSAGRRTFKAQAEWYRTHRLETHRGKRQEGQRLDQLVAAFGDLALEAITPTAWDEYRSRRLKEVSVNTVGNELTVMKLVLASAIGQWIDVSPLASVRRRKEKLPPKRTITRQEEPAFVAALAASDPEIRDLYLVGVGTLLRQSNLLELRRHEHRGAFLSVTTKTGPLRVPLDGPTPLQRRAAKVLQARLPSTSNGYFFPTWRARFAAYADPGHARVQFLRIVRAAAAAADIPWGIRQGGIVWHTATRATGATRMLRDYRIDIRTVQLIGGWTSLDQMMEYLGIDQEIFGRGTQDAPGSAKKRQNVMKNKQKRRSGAGLSRR